MTWLIRRNSEYERQVSMKNALFWKRLAVTALTLLLTYILWVCLSLCRSDWRASRFWDWPRNLEYTSLFWIDLCIFVALGQLWFAGVFCCVRLFRGSRSKRRTLPGQTETALLIGISVLLAGLTAVNIVNGRIYFPLYRAQADEAVEYAGNYYIGVICAELAAGAWIRLCLTHIQKTCSEERKENK